MDRKRLDLNAPLLSVRRFSSPIRDRTSAKTIGKPTASRQQSLPSNKSEWELEGVTKPAAIPFQWEQIPGRAKDEKNPPPPHSKELPDSPRFPPGRKLDAVKNMPVEDVKYLNPNRGFNRDVDISSKCGEGVHSDLLETLSLVESFSRSCSERSFSGSSGTSFSTDIQMRDYLMNRFIPAAKAMTVETPQYVPKKQPDIPEPPKLVRKVYSGELRPLLQQCRSNTISANGHYKGDSETEKEYDSPEKKMSKLACRFFPRLCVKSSLGLKSKTPAKTPLLSSFGDLRRMARTSYSGPLTPTFEKQPTNAVYRNRPVLKSKEVHEVENRSNDIPDYFYHSESEATGRRSGRISPYRNVTPPSPFRDGARFLGVPKEAENVEAKVNPLNNRKRDSSPSQVAEKTVYIDSLKTVIIPKIVVTSKAVGPFKRSDCTLLDSRAVEEGKKSIVQTRRDAVLKSKGSSDAYMLHSVRSKVHSSGNLDIISVEESGKKNLDLGSLQTLTAPPSPKSPSESWLWRTIFLRNPFLKKQSAKASPTSTKWENIVKTSNLHYDHARYSQELLLHVSQYSST